MRSASVFMPRSSSHAACGSRIAPSTPTSSRIGFTASAEPDTVPAIRSLWPPRYLVALWITRSAPSASGRWFTGEAKVESMITATPRSCATRTASGTSITRRYGLVGDSVKNSRVLSRSAALSAIGSAGSITVASTSSFASCCWMNWRVRR